jgi:hypothetical protein
MHFSKLLEVVPRCTLEKDLYCNIIVLVELVLVRPGKKFKTFFGPMHAFVQVNGVILAT